MSAELAIAEQTLQTSRDEAEQVATNIYMNAGAAPGTTLLDASTINEVPLRESYLQALSASGEETLTRFTALEDAYLEQKERLQGLQEDQEKVVAEADALANQILGELAEADAEYDAIVAAYTAQEEEKRRLEEERRRREAAEAAAAAEAARNATTTTAANPSSGGDSGDEGDGENDPPPPPPSSGQVCPVNGAVSFSDTFGASRSGGRAHQGVDMIAAKGTPAVAVSGGSVSLQSSSLGGITAYLYSGGDMYYYAHLDGYASGISSGSSVTTGQTIGYVGNSGNAAYTVSHLHFEYHPGGGGAVNPTPLVSSLC